MFRKSSIICLIIFLLGIILFGSNKSAIGASNQLFDMGKSYYDAGKFDEAVSILKKAFDEDPTNDKILDLLVNAMVKSEKSTSTKKTADEKKDDILNKSSIDQQQAKSSLDRSVLEGLKSEESNKSTKESVELKNQNIEGTENIRKSENAVSVSQPAVTIPVNLMQLNNAGGKILVFEQTDRNKSVFADKPAISKIETVIFSDITRFIIETTQQVNFVTEKLPNPPMLVIDLLDTVDNLPRGKNFPVNTGIIKKIRHSQYREIPAKTARIVIDLTNWKNNTYTATKSDNKIIVELVNPVSIPGVGQSNVIASSQKNILSPQSNVQQLKKEKIDIEILSYGKKQVTGSLCEQPIKLKVTKNGKPADGEKVIFESLTPSAGFKIFDRISSTIEAAVNNEGYVVIENFYSRPVQGENQIRVYAVNDNSSLKNIVIESILPTPDKIVKISGDNQKVNLNSINQEPFIVEVQDKKGNKVGPGIPVIFSTISKGCKVDVNNSNSFENEVVVYTDTSSRAKCDKLDIGSEPGLKVLKASILVDEPAIMPTRLLVTSQSNLTNAVETLIQGMKYKVSNDISIMVFETADTFNFKTVRDDLYVSLKEGGSIELYPHLNALFVSDENIFLSDIPGKIMNYGNFKITTKTLRSVDFSVSASPRLVTVNFKGAELIDVIRTLAELGDWNITYSEEDVKDKQVNLHLIDIPAISALDTILDMNDLTRVQDGNIMKIVLKSKAATNALPIRPDYSEDLGIGDNFVTQIVPLNNVDGQKLLTTISELKSENGKISYEQNTNSLLITDSKSKVKQLVQIIKTFDISAKTGQEDIRIYKLNYEKPSKIKDILTALLEAAKEEIEKNKIQEKSKSSKASKNEASKDAASPELESIEKKDLSAGRKLKGDAKIIDYDEKKMLLVQTTSSNHKVIESLIKDLDNNEDKKTLKVIELSRFPHIDPKDLKNLIINLKSLEANIYKDPKNPDADLFVPEEGLIIKRTKSDSGKEKDIIDYFIVFPKYQIFTSADKLLILGKSDVIDEVSIVIDELLANFGTDEKSGFALESLLSKDKVTKRVTLKHISVKQFEEYFNSNNWPLPLYLTGFESKTGREDILLIGENSIINDFIKKVNLVDIPELKDLKLDGVTLEMIQLKNLDVSNEDTKKWIDEVILPLLGAGSSVTSMGGSNRLLIRAKNSNVNIVKEIIEKADNYVINSKRITLKNITSKQIEEYFKMMNYGIPPYVGNLPSSSGKEDIMVFLSDAMIEKFKEKLEVIDIPALSASKLDGVAVEIYTLKNISIEDLTDQMVVLESALSVGDENGGQPGSITIIKNSNSLVIRDRVYNVNSVKDILKKLDKERSIDSVMSTEIVTMRNMEVGSLKNTFNNFSNIKSTNGEVVFDYVSNSVVIRDYQPNIKRLKEIFEKLDENAKNSNWMVTKIFNLKYSTVSDKLAQNNVKVTKISDVIDKIITSSVTTLDAKDGKIFGNVAYDERTNSIIVTTFRNLMPQVEKLIAQLDKREKQIMIEVLIVEREVSNSDVLGFNTMFGVDRYSSFNDATDAAVDATTGKPIDRVNFNGFGAGFQPGRIEGAPFWLTINAKQFAAALDSLKTTSTAEVLSNPKVLTINNQPAFVELKDIIQTPKYEKDENGIFKPVDPDKTEIPLSLTVVPQINHDREVLLTVDLKVSTLPADYDKSLGLPPSPTDRIINNMFYIADNQTIVIGGIIKKENRNAESKIPLFDFLDKVPILNMLSKKTSKSNLNKELLIFITPHIIEGTIQTEQISKSVKDKYSSIVYNNFYLNTASRSDIVTLYLNSIYKNLLENYYEKNRKLGKAEYNITKTLPAWLVKENVAEFADVLAKSIIRYREQFGPFTNFEQIQFVQFNFMNTNMNIKEELYTELASQTLLNLNINLVTAEELSRIKGFTYNIAQNIINERNKLGYFKDKNQARYYIIKYGIPAMYYDEYIGKILVVGDMKDKDSNQTLNDYKYLTEEPVQVKQDDMNIPVRQIPDNNILYQDNNTIQYYQEPQVQDRSTSINSNELPPLPPLPEAGLEQNRIESNQQSSNGKTNINSASIEELQNKLGISKLDAMLIVKYRERIGTYSSTEELKNVYGLDKTYEEIKNKITVK